MKIRHALTSSAIAWWCLAAGLAGCGSSGNGGGSVPISELGEWNVADVAMSGDESYTYTNVGLSFGANPTQVAFTALGGNTSYTWIGPYAKSGAAITVTDLAETNDATDVISLALTLVSDSSLVGTLTETYPKEGHAQPFTVTGVVNASRGAGL